MDNLYWRQSENKIQWRRIMLYLVHSYYKILQKRSATMVSLTASRNNPSWPALSRSSPGQYSQLIKENADLFQGRKIWVAPVNSPFCLIILCTYKIHIFLCSLWRFSFSSCFSENTDVCIYVIFFVIMSFKVHNVFEYIFLYISSILSTSPFISLHYVSVSFFFSFQVNKYLCM